MQIFLYLLEKKEFFPFCEIYSYKKKFSPSVLLFLDLGSGRNILECNSVLSTVDQFSISSTASIMCASGCLWSPAEDLRGSVRGSGFGQSQPPSQLHDPEGATIIYIFRYMTQQLFLIFLSSLLLILLF
jgi:hypothetical protein